jgi:TolB-like protein/Tfp pilus assembly protein PilF
MRFGVFEVDFRSGELRKQGVKIKLQKQPFQVLEILLERPGEVVTREELQKRIWPPDTFVDFEQGLHGAIKRLREALDDSAESPRFIETLSRRGYRFIAPASGTAIDAHAAPRVNVARDSIAVLPFTNISPDPENDFFADGITEEIINALAQIRELHVVARSSAFSFKGKHADARSVGERLNVRTVLEGSVRKYGNRLRITAQLVNAADGYHLWSERYDREMKDVFEIQDEIARSIAGLLRVTLEDKEQPFVKAGTENLEAYQLYVKGRASFFQRGHRLPTAVQCFQQAVVLDRNYGLAWAALADAYNMSGFYGLTKPEDCLPQAKDAAQRAVTLGSSLAEAHTALAMSSLLYDWDRSKAQSEFLLALELNPRYAQARYWYALYYLQWGVGCHEEGIAQAKHAMDCDPLSGYAKAMLAVAYINAGKMSEAEVAARAALQFDPDSFLARWYLLTALKLQGRYEETMTWGESTLNFSGRHPWIVATLALAYDECAKPAYAKAMYMELQWRAKREYVAPFVLAWAASAAREQNDAIRYAQEAHALGDPIWIAAKYWPLFARLRQYPQFQEMLASRGWT